MMHILKFCSHVIFTALLCTSCSIEKPTEEKDSKDGLIVNAVIYDGTGGAAQRGSVRIRNGLIGAIGDLEPEEGEEIWDANGLALAPGFIDPHSHHGEGLLENPAAPSVLAQGITTVTLGLDGESPKPLEALFAQFEENPVAVNIASFGGHNSYRHKIMGDNFKRTATSAEIDSMKSLLQRDLEAGALGLSTGLEYEPSLYSSTEEVIALAKVAATAGGRYTSHIRSEDIAVAKAVDEFLNIARAANIPANISHIKLAMNALWGGAPDVIVKLNNARAEGLDITADIYPYQGWQSTMQILLPERDYTDRAAFEYALTDIAAPESIIITGYEPEPSYVGKTLAEIAAERRMDPVDLMMEMAPDRPGNSGGARIIGRNMGAEDIRHFMQWPHTSISSDGSVDDRHPRGQGAFPRVLAKYVRDMKILTLAEAIHKMTGLAAKNLGLSGRGTITKGRAADLVLFDPEKIQDHATFKNPIAYATGIHTVWVNGSVVWQMGKPTGIHSGKILRRQDQ